MAYKAEIFISLVGTLLLTRSIWHILGRLEAGLFLVMLIGFLLLIFSKKITSKLPNYGMFDTQVQNRVLMSLSALLLAYGIWNLSAPFLEKYLTYFVIGGLFLIILQKPLGGMFVDSTK